MDSAWNLIPLYVQTFTGYSFFIWHPGTPLAPPSSNPSLVPNDSALLAAIETNLPAMNTEVANSVILARNTPPPAPQDPDATRFWRILVDPTIDTDHDGSPDWAEFEIAARGTGMLVAGVTGDPFDADTNGDGIPDGEQLDADLDGTADAKDIGPADPAAVYEIGPLPRYALFPITNAWPSESWKEPFQINNLGTVLYENGIWTAGVWKPLVQQSGDLKNCSARAINDHNVILGGGRIELATDQGTLIKNPVCYWAAPESDPHDISVGNRFPEASYDMMYGKLRYGPVLSNDGAFLQPTVSVDGTTVTYEHPGAWKLPDGNAAATEAATGDGLRFSGEGGAKWGFEIPRNPQGEVDWTLPLKGQLEVSGLPGSSNWYVRNLAQPPGGMAVAMSYNPDAPTAVWHHAGWHEDSLYAKATDMAADGTAIAVSQDGETAPILLNGKWVGIERTAPTQTDVFEPMSAWHDGTVSLLDTTPGGWILGRRETSPSVYEHAVMLPIRAEGYYLGSNGTAITESVGVDDFSVGSDAPGAGIEDRIWIMAPQGGFNKIVKFKVPLNSNTPLNLSASNILFGGQESISISGEVNPVTLRAADTVASGGERLMTVTLGSGDNEISSVSKPIGLKIMKGRTVNVTVYKVTKLYGTNTEEPVDQIMMPTQEEIANHLKDIFRPQINATFNVNLVDVPLTVRWDNDNDGQFDIQLFSGLPGEEDAILGEIPANPAAYNIRVFLVANLRPLGSGLGAYGLTDIPRATCWVLGSKFGKSKNKPFLLDTIAHEIGHVLVGAGHPDQDASSGPAPLPGTKHTRRLMCSGPNSVASSRLLVKKEWDMAEKWMKKQEDDGKL